jgi:hypothetical protein
MKLKRYYIQMLMEKPKDIEMAQNVGVQGVPSSSSTINMLFLELNTLKPL